MRRSRPAASPRTRDEPKASGGILHLPTEPFDLGPELIGRGEVAAHPGGLSLCREPVRLRRSLGARPVDPEPEDGEAARQKVELAGGAPIDTMNGRAFPIWMRR